MNVARFLRDLVVLDVVLVVFVAVADGDRSGHGHVYDHDLLRLSQDSGEGRYWIKATQQPVRQYMPPGQTPPLPQ